MSTGNTTIRVSTGLSEICVLSDMAFQIILKQKGLKIKFNEKEILYPN
jgi:hypothetical protein